MYLFTRAFSYLRKQKAKTALMLVLFLVIANIVLAGLAMNSAAAQAEEDLRQKIGANVTYTLNTRKVMEDTQNGTITNATDQSDLEGAPTYENFLKVIDSDYVASSDAVATYEVNTDAITPYTDTTAAQNGQSQNGQTGPGGAGGGRPEGFISGSYESAGDLTLTTFTSTEPTAFKNGTATLTEGRYATQAEIDGGAYVVLINETLAENNSIGLGDKIELTPVIDGEETDAVTYEVIGIYSTTTTLDSRMSQMIGSSLLPQNNLYTPFLTLKSIGLTDDELGAKMLSSATIVLGDPDDVSAYQAEAAKKVTLTYGTIGTESSTYSSVSASITSISNISGMLVLIVGIAGASILALITALTVNQRKNEIGILLAIGEAKSKIVAQLLAEVLIIAVIAFSLSMFTGSYIGEKITDAALSGTISTSRGTQFAQNGGTFGGTAPGTTQGGNTQGDPAEQSGQGNRSGTIAQGSMTQADLDVGLNLQVVLQLFGAGILISVVSVAIPAFYVTRYNPKQILTNNG